MAIVAMSLTSCEKNTPKGDGQKKGPNDGENDIEVTTHNSLSWLQGCIVSVDENGEIFRRIYGKPDKQFGTYKMDVQISYRLHS